MMTNTHVSRPAFSLCGYRGGVEAASKVPLVLRGVQVDMLKEAIGTMVDHKLIHDMHFRGSLRRIALPH